MTIAAQNARAALAAKQEAEQDLARLSLCPPWRHAAFAGIMAALVGAPAAELPWRFAVLTAAMVAVALVIRSDRRRLGVFINGYRRGKTRLVTFPMLAIIVILHLASNYASIEQHKPTISLLLAALTFAVGYVGSVIWQQVFVRELHG